MVSFLALVDLLAILPFYFALVMADMRFLRSLRLVRVLRILKVERYLTSFGIVATVVRKKQGELMVCFMFILLLLLVASCLMFFIEHDDQPDKFPNIPATMWWGIATLTTVGYGDVYPITVGGKLLAAVIAVLGIGLFALPTGILASGFTEELSRKRRKKAPPVCPHCGEDLSDHHSQGGHLPADPSRLA